MINDGELEEHYLDLNFAVEICLGWCGYFGQGPLLFISSAAICLQGLYN